MTCEEFIRNNRGINAGENLPQDFLRALYESISRNEIRISSEASVSASPVLWTQLAQASISPRGFMLEPNTLGESCQPSVIVLYFILITASYIVPQLQIHQIILQMLTLRAAKEAFICPDGKSCCSSMMSHSFIMPLFMVK